MLMLETNGGCDCDGSDDLGDQPEAAGTRWAACHRGRRRSACNDDRNHEGGEAQLKQAIPLWIRAQGRFEAGYGVASASELRAALGGVLEARAGPVAAKEWTDFRYDPQEIIDAGDTIELTIVEGET
jgi:hypothetical protein